MTQAILPAAQVLDMATINGAKLQGRDDTGAIEAGKRADIMAIDLSAPHLVPHLDTAGLAVYSAQAADVCMTMVDGRVLYENGEYLTLDGSGYYTMPSGRQAAVRRVREKENTHGTSRQGPCLYDAV